MRPLNATRRPGGGVSAVTSSGKTVPTENSTNTSNGQASVIKRRCPGCARQCRKFVSVRGWHAERAALICKRCASGLILASGHVTGLKRAPEVRS